MFDTLMKAESAANYVRSLDRFDGSGLVGTVTIYMGIFGHV
jgi:hypothetical protein